MLTITIGVATVVRFNPGLIKTLCRRWPVSLYVHMHVRLQDLVVPSFKWAQHFSKSPLMGEPQQARTTLLYFKVSDRDAGGKAGAPLRMLG